MTIKMMALAGRGWVREECIEPGRDPVAAPLGAIEDIVAARSAPD